MQIKDILSHVDGYKTYILVGCAVLLWLGVVSKLWTLSDIDELFGLLAILGIGTFRSALNK